MGTVLGRLDDKINMTEGLVRRVVGAYTRPVLAWSSGKDSMVLLHILRKRMGLDLPAVFYREPFGHGQKKYAFANRIIQEWKLTAYDYPPVTTTVVKNGKNIELINWYQVGKTFAYTPTGIREPEDGKPWLCGLLDLYRKPTGTFHDCKGGQDFPWDVCFIGHKNCDVDPIMGAVRLKVDVRVADGFCDYAFPLRGWSNAEIWEYTERFHVPFNERRYDKANGYKEFADITYNPDYWHACMRCLDKDGPATVFCPRLQAEIPNISGEIRSHEPPRVGYIATDDAAGKQGG